MGAVESQVWVQGTAGTEVWLGVKLARTKGSVIGFQWGTAETGGREQQVVRQAERERQGRVDGAEL